MSPLFQRQYPAITKVIKGLSSGNDPQWDQQWEEKFQGSLKGILPDSFFEKYQVLGTDVTPISKPQSRCHAERRFTYTPSNGSYKKPITIGHACSCLSLMSPEKRWLIPLSFRRLGLNEVAAEAGLSQLRSVLSNKDLALDAKPCIHLGDCSYSTASYLYQSYCYENLIQIVRLRGNRNLFEPYRASGPTKGSGRLKRYGKKFNLAKPETWPCPSKTHRWELYDRKGELQYIDACEWEEIVMAGKKGMPMWDKPFRLISFQLLHQDGRPKFKRRLWICVFGKQKDPLDLEQIYALYHKRFDLEHFFRFAKQRLLLQAFQSPDVAHMENWWKYVQMAWTLLYAARFLAKAIPAPWERYLKLFKDFKESDCVEAKSPSIVQKDYINIIQAFEKLIPAPKPVKKAKGRQKGEFQPKRRRFEVIRKNKKKPKAA